MSCFIKIVRYGKRSSYLPNRIGWFVFGHFLPAKMGGAAKNHHDFFLLYVVRHLRDYNFPLKIL